MKNKNFNVEVEHQDIWVVFSGETDLPWLKFLKQGFRHCFVLINDGQRWVSVDPLSPYTEILVYHHVSPSFDLPLWLEGRGYKVVRSFVDRNNNKQAPIMVFTCVEAIKRILGLHKRFIFTPWQLYKALIKNNKNIKNKDNQKQFIKGDLQWVA